MERVLGELTVVGGMALFGIGAGAVYWVLRLMRRFLWKNAAVDTVLDLLFYCAAGVLLGLGLLKYTSGTLRLYALLSFAVGTAGSVALVFTHRQKSFEHCVKYYKKDQSALNRT